MDDIVLKTTQTKDGFSYKNLIKLKTITKRLFERERGETQVSNRRLPNDDTFPGLPKWSNLRIYGNLNVT